LLVPTFVGSYMLVPTYVESYLMFGVGCHFDKALLTEGSKAPRNL